MPLICHFCDAGRPAEAAEMTQMPRLAAVLDLPRLSGEKEIAELDSNKEQGVKK